MRNDSSTHITRFLQPYRSQIKLQRRAVCLLPGSLLYFLLWNLVTVEAAFISPKESLLKPKVGASLCPTYACPLISRDIYFDVETKEALRILKKDEEDDGLLQKGNLHQWALETLAHSGSHDEATLTLIGYKGGAMEEQINQDRSFVLSPFQWWYPYKNTTPSFIQDSTYRLLGVFDGHGRNGEVVSQYAIDNLPILLASKLNHLLLNNHTVAFLDDLSRSEAIEKILIETFVELDQTAPAQAAIMGGCTASILFQWGYQLYIANVGDSRTFVVSSNSDDLSSSTWVEILHATREDKPHLQDERKRIEDMGGQVYIPPSHQLGSTSRVMYSNVQEGSGIHGLAMSRSLGDWTAGKVGVIPNPIVDVLDLRNYLFVNESLDAPVGDTGIRSNVNIFAFSATDGLLDYISEQEIAERVSSSFYQDEGIHPLLVCESLILEAAGRWWQANGGRYRDDISIAISKLSVS